MIRFIFLMMVLLSAVYVGGQNTMLTNTSVNFSKTIPSPTAGGIAQIASTDVSIFTGLANVQIPVFSVNDGDVVISATLKYNSGGVKVADRPSWVGQNWNLMVGGVITRSQKGDPDEICKAFLSVPSQAGYAESAGLLNVANWSTAGFLENYSTSVPTKHIDPQPDEFAFSLPSGESGSFFLNHLNQWEVKTKSNGYFRVVSSEYKLDWVFVSPNPNIGTTTTVKRVFHKFVLKDGKGYTYTFGGVDNAVEFGRGTKRGFDWLDNPIDDNCNGHIVATSWYLTKIVSPLGIVVEFDYLRGKHQYMLNAVSPRNGTTYGPIFECVNNSGADLPTMAGYVITPSVLSKIRASNFTVDFFADTVKQLDYPFAAYNFNYSSFLDGDLDRLHIAHNNPPSFYEGLNRWYALSGIEIKDYRGQLREKYAFGYEEHQPQLERLFLTSFHKIDVSNTLNRVTHSFEYYDVGTSVNHGLPGYCSFKTDLWGYYNGKQYPISGGQTFSEAQLASFRTMDPGFAIAGSLKKVVYPTGGALELFYQANDYHHVIEKTSTEINFVQRSGFGGGLRIWKVRMLDNLGNFSEKRYAYSPMSNTEISSGILAGAKKDKIEVEMGVLGPCCNNYCKMLAWQFDDFSTLNYTDGRDVVYSEGREYLTDGSYTNYEYSNSNNPAYRDVIPVKVISNNFKIGYCVVGEILSNTSSNTNPHLAHCSYDLERGNLLSKTRYSSVGFLVDREEYVYNDDPGRFNKFVRSISNYEYKYHCDNPNQAGCFIELRENYYQAIKIFTYRPYVIRKYEYTYNANASTYQFRRYDYTYDPETYVLKSVATHNSKSEYKVTSYVYAKDFPSDPVLSELYNGRSRVEDVVQKTETLNGSEQLKEIISYGYFNSGQQIAPSSVTLVRRGLAPFVSIHVDAYNSKGQITKAHKPNDVTITKLYGYNDHLVEAIVENASESDCFYNSFEWRTGYTIFNPEPFVTIADPNAVTGRNVGRVQSSRPIKTGLDPNKSYIVTYWTKSRSSLYVNTSANGELVKDVGEWRLFKHIAQPVNGQINLGSTSETYIDELRLYPVGATMETFTYDPMWGVTATCNRRNLVRFYEYDGLGRLVLMRDEFRKVLKVFAYNYNAHPND